MTASGICGESSAQCPPARSPRPAPRVPWGCNPPTAAGSPRAACPTPPASPPRWRRRAARTRRSTSLLRAAPRPRRALRAETLSGARAAPPHPAPPPPPHSPGPLPAAAPPSAPRAAPPAALGGAPGTPLPPAAGLGLLSAVGAGAGAGGAGAAGTAGAGSASALQLIAHRPTAPSAPPTRVRAPRRPIGRAARLAPPPAAPHWPPGGTSTAQRSSAQHSRGRRAAAFIGVTAPSARAAAAGSWASPIPSQRPTPGRRRSPGLEQCRPGRRGGSPGSPAGRRRRGDPAGTGRPPRPPPLPMHSWV